MIRRLLPLLIVSLIATGCARQVTIRSEPVPARIHLGGEFVGYTPLTLHLGGDDRHVRVESPGYIGVAGRLRRRFDGRSLLAVLAPPLLLLPHISTRLQGEYLVVLEEGEGLERRGVIEGRDE